MTGRMHRTIEGYADPTAWAAMRGDNNITSPNHGILRVTLPLPPSVNHYYFTARNGRRLMTDAAKAWMETAQWTIKQASMAAGWRMSTGRLTTMRIWVFWPDRRRRDVGNLHKALGDAPEGIVYKDDQWLLLQDWGMAVDPKRPRVEIEIEEAR